VFKRRGDVASGRSNWAVILAWGYNLKAVWPDRESKIVEAGGYVRGYAGIAPLGVDCGTSSDTLKYIF